MQRTDNYRAATMRSQREVARTCAANMVQRRSLRIIPSSRRVFLGTAPRTRTTTNPHRTILPIATNETTHFHRHSERRIRAPRRPRHTAECRRRHDASVTSSASAPRRSSAHHARTSCAGARRLSHTRGMVRVRPMRPPGRTVPHPRTATTTTHSRVPSTARRAGDVECKRADEAALITHARLAPGRRG